MGRDQVRAQTTSLPARRSCCASATAPRQTPPGLQWVPITDADGAALPGAITITDPNGVTSVDARNTTDLPAFKGTDYQRPEDMQSRRVDGPEYLYVTTTTTHEVYRLDLAPAHHGLRQPGHHRPGDRRRVGTALASPDNLAIDHDGNIYIVEDRNGGVTTTSGSRGTSTRTATSPMRAKGSAAGRRMARSGPSSPACTSTPPTSVARG